MNEIFCDDCESKRLLAEAVSLLDEFDRHMGIPGEPVKQYIGSPFQDRVRAFLRSQGIKA